MFKKIRHLPLRKIIVFLLIFSVGVALGFGYFTNTQKQSTNLQQERNTHKAFLSEVYDKIKENYWDNISDATLVDLFKLATEKASGKPQIGTYLTQDQLMKMMDEVMKGMDDQKKRQFSVNVAGAVLASLSPSGRSGLFTQKQEEQLKNTVENIDPSKDLYKDLSLLKGASEEEVNRAFQQQSEELKKQTSQKAQEKLKQITYAKDVLSQMDRKEKYDQKGIEPTIFSKIPQPGVLYLQFKKFSPTSLEEFQKAFETYKDRTEIYGLILDLRGNMGGAIDATAYFLGFFIGKNQYAFDFFHKGQYLPFKTPTDKLPTIGKFKQIIVLVDNNTQSSAEMMAASLKKYNVGVVLGVPTKGWGTVERVFPLDNQLDKEEKYSMFLAHSITLRDDNQPIEGRGVEPNINIKDSDWEQQLFSYFRNQALIEAIKAVIPGVSS